MIDGLLQVLLALVLALPIAWALRHSKITVDICTLPIVAMASCGFALIVEGHEHLVGPSLTMQGIAIGVGMVGGTVVLKSRRYILRFVTATSLGNAGAIGMAIAYDHVQLALAMSLLNVVAVIAAKKYADRLE